jgi:diguanylate cyclase (GGDEF)-like protein
MSDPQRDEVLAKLAQLRHDYLKHLPEELAALQTIGEALNGHDEDRLELEAIYQRLHKLAGSGGTFGLKALSSGARSLEQRVKGWLGESPLVLDTPTRHQLVADLTALMNTLAQVEMPASFIPPDTTSAPLGTSVCIWLVDDDVMLGKEIVQQLESFNYQVRRFERLADAEAAAKKESPDILLMDVMFEQEGMNATEAFSHLPNLSALNCPLLFISSFDDFSSRMRASKLFAAGYFLKPLDVPRLVSRISHLIDKRSEPPQRVLIVDDDKELIEHFRLVLGAAGMNVATLEQTHQMMDTITDFRPELVLMDMHMPDFSGPELAGVIRQYDSWTSLPIVYLSAETDLEQQIQAMDRGADDFLTKPISDAQLVAAVRVRIQRARHLAEQISRDSLTGLLKHASIKEAAEIEVTRARRNSGPVTLAMLDIDHFKLVNDNYGHAVGDVVISSVAMLLRQRLRQSDIIGRYGGEEFVAVLPDCDAQSAYQLMDDIRQRFSQLRFSHEGKDFTCTISAGLACSTRYPDSDGAALLVAADEALYLAKRGGRNQVREAE